MEPSSQSKGWPRAILILRLLTFLFLLLSIVLLATDTVTLTIDDGNSSAQQKVRFKDLYAYRYVFWTAVIGCAYTLLQIPFAVYFVSRGTRLGGDGLLYFDLHGDKIMALLLASAVGAGFGITMDPKRLMNDYMKAVKEVTDAGWLRQPISKLNKFFDMAQVSTGFLLLGLLCLIVLSIGSSHALAKRGLSP